MEAHWLSPSNRRLRESASEHTICEYAEGVFDKDYKEEEAPASREKRRKLVPNVEWIARKEVVASCGSLKAEKYIQSVVLHALASARHHHEYVEDGECEQVEEEAFGK